AAQRVWPRPRHRVQQCPAEALHPTFAGKENLLVCAICSCLEHSDVVQSLELRIEVREISLERKVVPISFENAAVATADEHLARTRHPGLEVAGADREEAVRVPTARHDRVYLLERQIGIPDQEVLDPALDLAVGIENGCPAFAAEDDSPREQERNPGVPVDGVFGARRDVDREAVRGSP